MLSRLSPLYKLFSQWQATSAANETRNQPTSLVPACVENAGNIDSHFMLPNGNHLQLHLSGTHPTLERCATITQYLHQEFKALPGEAECVSDLDTEHRDLCDFMVGDNVVIDFTSYHMAISSCKPVNNSSIEDSQTVFNALDKQYCQPNTAINAAASLGMLALLTLAFFCLAWKIPKCCRRDHPPEPANNVEGEGIPFQRLPDEPGQVEGVMLQLQPEDMNALPENIITYLFAAQSVAPVVPFQGEGHRLGEIGDENQEEPGAPRP